MIPFKDTQSLNLFELTQHYSCAVGGTEGDAEEGAGHQIQVVFGGEGVFVIDPFGKDGGRAAPLELLNLHFAVSLSAEVGWSN